MPMHSPTLTGFVVALAGLLLGGCTVYTGFQTGAAGTEPKPKVVLVSDFTFASDVVAIDRGYTARLERKVGTYPTHERRQRTTERVNDEIVAHHRYQSPRSGPRGAAGRGGRRHA